MCEHTTTFISPEREVVCSECCRVLETSLGNEISDYRIDEVQEFHLREELLDVFALGHFPMGIFDLVMFHFSRRLESEKFRNFKKKEVLCFALYETLIREKISRSPGEIASYFDIPIGKLWSMERLLNDFSNVSYAEMIERFCAALRVPYKYQSDVMRKVLEFEVVSCSQPQTLIASAIFKIIQNTTSGLNTSLKDICQVCGTSTAAVRTVLRYVKLSY